MTDEYNASDRKSIRKARKAARAADRQRQRFVFTSMSSPAGRNYIHDLLVRCHVFSTSFNVNALSLAFAEGERNVGLGILNDIMAAAPDQYILMMREANDRANATNSRLSGDNPDGRRGDSDEWVDDTTLHPGGFVESEYDPTGDQWSDPADGNGTTGAS